MDREKTVIALGFFDGVHLGHGALLRRAAQAAQTLGAIPAAFTFDRPPKAVVTGTVIPQINTVQDRVGLMERQYGISRVVVAPFDRAMMQRSWQDFIALLLNDYGAIHLVAGHDYRFGYRNEGTPELLMTACARLGLGCDIIPKVALDGVTVSSTYIRSLLSKGEVENAARFLGHPHCLSQTVGHGRRFGRTIGVPTVNFTPPQDVLLPACGVYVSRVIVPDGRALHGVTNVGTRPTVSSENTISVETHLLDFAGDLYDQTIRVEFLHRLRQEKRFDSPQALRRQIEADMAAAQDYFSEQ